MLIFDTATTTDSSNPFGSVKDFFHSGTWDLVRNLSIFFLVIFWLASAYWVYKDARRRVDDNVLIAIAVALGIFPPFVGPLLYMFFRPPEYLEDVRERELEIKAMEETLGAERCPVCRAPVDVSFLSCPVCTTKLKQACRRCKAPLEQLWQICPYCETPIESPRAVENL